MVASVLDVFPKVSYTFHAPSCAAKWRVRQMDLREEVSTPYQCDLELMSEDPSAVAKTLLGASCTLEISRGALRRRVHGVISQVEDRGTTSEHVIARARLGPALALASNGVNTRTFQERTVPEIVKEVLEAPLSICHRKLELPKYVTFAKREFCCQYRESDLAFVRRLMAEEGISYFFDQSGDTETMVLVVNNDAFPSCETLEGGCVPASGGSLSGHAERLYDFGIARSLGPTRVAVRSFDWTRPLVDFKHEVEAADEGDGLASEIYEHSLRAMFSAYEEDELRYSKEHLEEHSRLGLERARASQVRCTGSSNVIGIGAGSVIESTGHAQAELDQRYLVVRVRHFGRSSEDLATTAETKGEPQDDYRNAIECIPVTVAFRPKLPALRPEVHGLLTATVVGPAGEEIHTDEHGRIRVQFHWDRKGKRDEKSSCWVRVAQAWAGAGFGSVFLPRIGAEVLVQFVEADPDQPLVVGSVYNGFNRPPLLLPGEKTRNTIRTASTPGSAGYNELRFDDAKGGEEIYLHAERDLSEEVKRDRAQVVGRDSSVTVRGMLTEHVTAGRIETVLGPKVSTVLLGRVETVGGAAVTIVKGAKTETVQESETRKLQQSQTLEVEGNRCLWVNGFLSTQVGTNDRPSEASTSVLGKHSTYSTETSEIVSDEEIVLRCGKSQIRIGPEDIEIATQRLSVVAKESILLKANGPELQLTDKAELDAKAIDMYSQGASLELSSNADLNGAKVNLKCGGGSASAIAERVAKGETKPLKMKLHDDAMQPFADKKYRLIVAGLKLEGTTDGSGGVSLDVPKEAKVGQLTLWLDDYPTGPRIHWPIELSDEELPPATEVKGAVTRLRDLGYYSGEIVASLTTEVMGAIRLFQDDNEIEVTGELDSATSSKLEDVHSA